MVHFPWFQLFVVHCGLEADDLPDLSSQGQEWPSTTSQCLRLTASQEGQYSKDILRKNPHSHKFYDSILL